MSEIEFTGVPQQEIEPLKKVFEYIARAKASNSLNEAQLAECIGSKSTSYFVNPTKEEADEMVRQWRLNPNIELRWDFGSWFDALESAELEYQELKINSNGDGKLIFEQLAWPSGGIDATEELIRAFGGDVSANDAI